MRIPPELNLVRFTGFGGGLFVPTPKGFERADPLDGDHQNYSVRKGFRLARCPGAHGFDRGCDRCAPFHGAIAVPQGWSAHWAPALAVPSEERMVRRLRLADRNDWLAAAWLLERKWDAPRAARGWLLARSAAWSWVMRCGSTDDAVRLLLSRARRAGLLGRRAR